VVAPDTKAGSAILDDAAQIVAVRRRRTFATKPYLK